MSIVTTTTVTQGSQPPVGHTPPPRHLRFRGNNSDSDEYCSSDRPKKHSHILGTLAQVGSYLAGGVALIAGFKFFKEGLNPFSLFKSIEKKKITDKDIDFGLEHKKILDSFGNKSNAVSQWLSEMNTRATGWFYKGLKVFTSKPQKEFIGKKADDMFELANGKKAIRKDASKTTDKASKLESESASSNPDHEKTPVNEHSRTEDGFDSADELDFDAARK